MNAISGSAKLIQFESDRITLLKLSPGGIVGGWEIIPLTPPVVRKLIVGHQNFELTMFVLTQITKQQVDSFSHRQAIPSCILTAEWTEQGKPSRLGYKMDLSGAKKPSNYFIIALDTGPTPPGIPRGGLMCMIMCAGYQIL